MLPPLSYISGTIYYLKKLSSTYYSYRSAVRFFSRIEQISVIYKANRSKVLLSESYCHASTIIECSKRKRRVNRLKEE